MFLPRGSNSIRKNAEERSFLSVKAFSCKIRLIPSEKGIFLLGKPFSERISAFLIGQSFY